MNNCRSIKDVLFFVQQIYKLKCFNRQTEELLLSSVCMSCSKLEKLTQYYSGSLASYHDTWKCESVVVMSRRVKKEKDAPMHNIILRSFFTSGSHHIIINTSFIFSVLWGRYTLNLGCAVVNNKQAKKLKKEI